MALKYPNKIKRSGYWKKYERAQIKDYRKVWNITMSFIIEKDIPFIFSKLGRTPNLTRKEYVCMSILHTYFNLDFRETEHIIELLIGKQLDHTNCTRWFGKLTQEYVSHLVFNVHKKIIGIENIGDYIVDATKISCDRLEIVENIGENQFKHILKGMHIIVQYVSTLGLVSIVNVFASSGKANESPILRKKLLDSTKLNNGRRLHADKGYFGKENLKACNQFGLQPNIVPKEQKYSDAYLKKYVKNGYDNESRKKTRGLIETTFGGLETETGMKIKCRKEKHRDITICLMALKHNLRTYLRATALMVITYFAPTSG